MKNSLLVLLLVSAPGWRLFSSALIPTANASPAFRLALPGYNYSFPRDHNSHPDYSTEWWYFTGHLKSKDGRLFGYQATWFRTALAPQIRRQSSWAVRDVMFAHLALTDVNGKRFYFSDGIGRAALGLSGATTNAQQPKIWINDWTLDFSGKNGQRQHFKVAALSDATATQNQPFALDLRTLAEKPPVIHGENGVSQKSSGRGHASYYYSYTHLQTSGTLRVGNETLQVSGQSWFDHEFGSNQMSNDQTGWDWFSLQLSDGRELMLYRLRLRNGNVEPLSSGTLVDKAGRSIHLPLRAFRLTPLSTWSSSQTGAKYPARWKIEIPGQNLNLEVTPALANQELRPQRSGTHLSYWEGLVSAQGTANNQPISGQGYLEMTGYASAFRGTF